LLKIQKLGTIKPKTTGTKKHNVPMIFENFELGFENTAERQNVMLRLKSMQVHEFNIPKSPHMVTCEPLTSSIENTPLTKIFSLNPNDSSNFRLYYSRISPKDEISLSEIWVRLEDLHIILKRQQTTDSVSSEFATPDIQKIIQNLVNMIDSRRQQILTQVEAIKEKEGTIKENLEKLSFDLRWEFEMGDCEVTYADKDDNNKPRGTFKVANIGQMKQIMNRFFDLEHQLIQSKVDMAQLMGQSESERDDLMRKVREMEEKLQVLQKDRETYENKYIQAKMELSEVQMQNQDLQRNIFHMEKKVLQSKGNN